MGDTNPNIQVSFSKIQEFKDLDLFNLTWEQTTENKFTRLMTLDHRLWFYFMLHRSLMVKPKRFVLMATFNYS
jgi:hypothetical protein